MKFLIVFSKDRPWQLSEYLRTYQKYCDNCEEVDLRIVWTASSSEFEYRYNMLFLQLGLKNKFCSLKLINEKDHGSFKNALIQSLLRICSSDQVMFGVDDVLFYRNFKYINVGPGNIQSFRLGKNITYCQPANRKQKNPTINIAPIIANEYTYFYYSPDFIKNMPDYIDWTYPYELGGSIYNYEDIKFIQFVKAKTPNFLEEQMHIHYLQGEFNTTLYFNERPSCSVITVNRVQNDFKNKLAGQEITPEMCNKLFDEGREYDDEQYAKNTYNSIHIGDFILKDNS